jgi:hypothetical protein
MLNSTSIIVIGGLAHSEASNKTFILNSWSQSLATGPTLKNARLSHSCSRIRKNASLYSIIVAGGSGPLSFYLSSVEILDEGANSWRDGPNLPIAITRAAMIEDPTGGVILIGGRSSTNSYLDSLYRLAHAGEDTQWVKLPQTLKVARSFLTAILIPDHIANCTFF